MFLQGMGAGAAIAAAAPVTAFASRPEQLRAVLLHLGSNMWCDWAADGEPSGLKDKRAPKKELICRREYWRKATDHAAARGLNCVVVDLGEGVVFPSHPELAVAGSWTADEMREEVRRLRTKGIEAIPKLNFSTTHNGWLKDYRRRISTPEYYALCRDLVRDSAEIFEHPRFFHVGYDEETVEMQKACTFEFRIARAGELWWNDFLRLVRDVESAGMRPWMWSDFGWRHPEFIDRCPKSVLQSNWFYDDNMEGFDLDLKAKSGAGRRLGFFVDLQKAGFEQVPCGSNWMSRARKAKGVSADHVMGELIRFCRRHISPELLKGFMMASWDFLDRPGGLDFNLRAIDLLADGL
jgi:hypothetical protein